MTPEVIEVWLQDLYGALGEAEAAYDALDESATISDGEWGTVESPLSDAITLLKHLIREMERATS